MKVELSPYQEQVKEAFVNGSGNMFLSASAGSGKTFIIVYLAQFVKRTLNAIFLAFNTHIVEALKGRLPSHIPTKTMNSLGNAACRKACGRNPYLDQYKYNNKARDMVAAKSSWQDLKYNEKREYAATLSNLIDKARCTVTDYNDEQALMDMAGRFGVEVKDPAMYAMVKEAIEWGIVQFRQNNTVDYTDQLWMPYILGLDCEKYDFIMVDEAQDLNRLQHYMLQQSSHHDTRVVFVGDPMQSMYGFTGALVNSLQLLKKMLDADEYSLPICYRCPRKIIQVAQFFDRGRTLPHENAPEGIVEFITQGEIYNRVSAGDLILCRLTAPLVGVCIKLIAKNVSAKVLGREIGASLIKLVEDSMAKGDDNENPDWNAFPDRLRMHVGTIRDKLSRQQNMEQQIDLLNDKQDCIETCYRSADFNTNSMKEFITGIERLFDNNKSQITLCTVHKAKGLEADNVFIIQDKNGRECIPLIRQNQQRWELDQEINIGYVATTRAKKAMYICSSTKELIPVHRDFYLNGGIRKFLGNGQVSVTETEKTLPPPERTITVTKPRRILEEEDEPEPVVRKKKKKLKPTDAITDHTFKVKPTDAPVPVPGYMQPELFERKPLKRKILKISKVIDD